MPVMAGPHMYCCWVGCLSCLVVGVLKRWLSLKKKEQLGYVVSCVLVLVVKVVLLLFFSSYGCFLPANVCDWQKKDISFV